MKHRPTADQLELMRRMGVFIQDDENSVCFILRGYAGTGKTTFIAALVRTLSEYEQPFALMAPTGRAAKVLSTTAHSPASTIHRSIYSVEENASGFPSFALRVNTLPGTLFIVDEASMVAQHPEGGSARFSQNLLADLVAFVKGAAGCRLLLVGDVAQLPPVGESLSPALDTATMVRYFRPISDFTLTEVVRQQAESGILHYATRVRKLLDANEIVLPKFSTRRFPDFRQISRVDFLETLQGIFRRSCDGEAIILTRSNRRANEYNRFVRRSLLDCEDDLTSGDKLMVCRNSYFWTKADPSIPFIANGDMIRLKRVANRESKYGMNFADIEFTLEDYGGNEVEATCMLDVLDSNVAALPADRAQELYRAVYQDIERQHGKKGIKDRIRRNKYLNALQLKHGYAVTCHKAQGGQWASVLVDLELYPSTEVSRDLLRWIYTAITRATRIVYLIAPPPSVLEADSVEEY